MLSTFAEAAARQASSVHKKPRHLIQVAGFRRRPIDRFANALSLPPSPRIRRDRRVGRTAQKCKNPTEINPVGFLVLATSYSRTAYRRTTIGAAAFHCRVRNGNGWGHCVIVTRNLGRPCRRKFLVRDWRFVTSLQRMVFPLLTFVTVLTFLTFHDSMFQRTADSLTTTYRDVIRDSLHRYNGFPIPDLTLQRFTSSKNNFNASFCF